MGIIGIDRTEDYLIGILYFGGDLGMPSDGPSRLAVEIWGVPERECRFVVEVFRFDPAFFGVIL